VLASLVLLVTVIGLFLGLARPHPPLPSSVAATIPVGTGPVGVAVAPDSGHAYVTNAGSGSVSVIDIGSNTVTVTISVGTSPQGVAVTPDGRYAYITNRDSSRVSVIDIASNTVAATILVGTDQYG
jgi:YVTN family beta-propeller protein